MENKSDPFIRALRQEEYQRARADYLLANWDFIMGNTPFMAAVTNRRQKWRPEETKSGTTKIPATRYNAQ
jgi:hypothetical protein